MSSATKIVTGKCRLSYCHLFKPHAMDDKQEPKYSVSLIIPKSDTVTIKKIKAAIEAAIEAGSDKLASKSGKVVKAAIKLPLRDGDAERADDDAYADAYFINANAHNKPGIVDKDLNAILDPTEVYSGCYGRASITFFAYNVGVNKGIGVGLNNIQKLSEGDPLGSVSHPEDDFADDFEDDDLLS